MALRDLQWTVTTLTGYSAGAQGRVGWSNLLQQYAVGMPRTVTNHQIATSYDGYTWSSPLSNMALRKCEGVCFSETQGQWVAVSSLGLIVTSPDGVTWTSQANTFGGTNLGAVAFSENEDQWVVGGVAKIGTSPDAVTWTQQTNPFSSTISKIARSENQDLWVAVGTSDIGTSSDGVTWTLQTHPFPSTIYSVARDEANDIWVATGGNNSIAISSGNASSWSLVTGPLYSTNSIFDVAYSEQEGRWMAVGGSGGAPNLPGIAVSEDGSTWERISFPAPGPANGFQGVSASSRQGQWVVSGDNLQIMTSEFVPEIFGSYPTAKRRSRGTSW